MTSTHAYHAVSFINPKIKLRKICKFCVSSTAQNKIDERQAKIVTLQREISCKNEYIDGRTEFDTNKREIVKHNKIIAKVNNSLKIRPQIDEKIFTISERRTNQGKKRTQTSTYRQSGATGERHQKFEIRNIHNSQTGGKRRR